ncbi:MAG TPA: GNAT family N-acetyltransferase [Solirubrobacterales bacterium]|nr:GNAT family N-acetyltransferase [Solirubrobacterales bacterium]
MSALQAGAGIRDVVLRDGTTLRLRPPALDDADELLGFLRRLSSDSLYLRFHGTVSVGPNLVEPVLDPDWVERGALIGAVGEAAGERIVALGSYVRLREPALAEVAFAVADELQGKGVGTRLLEQLADIAGEVGIESFLAEVLSDNTAMLHVLKDAGFEQTRQREGGVVEVRLRIEATANYLAEVAGRDHVAVAASLRPFFEPTAVAVIGASTRRGSIGGELFRNILAGDFKGTAYPVNARGEPVAGVRAYSSVEEIPDPVDLAVIAVPGERVLDAAESALREGVRALCVISAGFAEIGPEGLERQERLLALVRAHGGRMIGPNCLGIALSGPRLNATFGPPGIPAGNIGFSSQSGALGLAFLQEAASRGLGLSGFVSIGNKADVSSNDLLEHWEDDPSTEVILLYLESFGNPRRFGRIARRVARSKPVLAMKSGRSRAGARAAGSHTAALAGSEQAVDALFAQAGVIRADRLGELLDVASLLATQPLPKGRSVAVVTNAGGLGILCADACEAAGLELPELSDETRDKLATLLPGEASISNPIDLLGSATGATYEATLPAILADARVDALIVLFVPPVVAGAEEVAAAIRTGVDGMEELDKPVLAVVMSASGTPEALRNGLRPIARFDYPESAAAALGLAAGRADWLRQPAGTVPELGDINAQAAQAVVADALAGAEDVWLTPQETRVLLEAYRIPLVPERQVRSEDEALAAAHDLGFPIAAKTAAPGAHKTETGGVALDVRDEAELRSALAQIGLPATLQPMIRGFAEFLAGVVQDPVFGPLVAFGPGGVLAELIGEAQIRIAPITDADAADLVLSGKSGRLVRGFRAPPSDAAALVDLVHRLSRLADDVPEVAELDLNPVMGLEEGCVAVDARIRLRRPQRVRPTKTW